MPVKNTGHRSPPVAAPAKASKKTSAKRTTEPAAAPRPPPPPKARDVVEVPGAVKSDWAGFCGDGPVNVKIQRLTSPAQNSAGRVVFDWDKKGDKIPFELTVRVDGDASKVRAELWTNANRNDKPDAYAALLMKPVKQEGNLVTYRVEVPIDQIGNYRATARVSTDGGRTHSWAGDAGIQDLRFRPHVEAHDGLNMMEVNISSVNGGRGTLADLTGPGSPKTNGKYTLEFLKEQGVNSVWVQPPFKRSVWEYRHPLDDAGSPYAAKDYFAVDSTLSAKAQEILARGGSQEQADAAALQEWKDFVAKAHQLGIKVIVDVALNHVGHNFEFADLFVRYDEAGREIREVRKNDFSQLAVNPEQLKVIEQRLADPDLPDYMEYVAPWFYASRSGDRRGAQSASDIMSGGDQWHDTKQLNTGGVYGAKNEALNRETTEWLGRVLEYWAVDLGCDGFRLDHLQGLPDTIKEQGLNLAQAAVDKHRPGVQLYVTGEDFANPEWNASHLDSIQDTWMRNTLAHPTPQAIRDLLSNPYFDNREMLNLSSHDEHRWDFHGDMKNAARMYSLLPLLGGTSLLIAGDEYGEQHSMPFKQHNPVGALQTPSPAGEMIAEQVRRAGTAKLALPALADNNRAFLDARHGRENELLAMARFPDAGKKGNPVVVFANFNNGRTRENAFSLDAQTLSRIDPDKRYQVRDLMGADPKATLWDPPLTGRELIEKGIFARLAPYQVQALELYEVR